MTPNVDEPVLDDGRVVKILDLGCVIRKLQVADAQHIAIGQAGWLRERLSIEEGTLRLFKSSNNNSSPRRTILACCRLTAPASSTTSQSGLRPRIVTDLTNS